MDVILLLEYGWDELCFAYLALLPNMMSNFFYATADNQWDKSMFC